jgi:two-component system NarL family response regulator
MRSNGVIIATKAVFLADTLRDKLQNLDVYPVLTVRDEQALAGRIQEGYPRFVLMENCFHEQATEEYILRLLKRYRDLRIVVWSASEVKPAITAPYILAGAESFFTLRDTDERIDNILGRIMAGRRYCPAEAEAVIEGSRLPVIGKGLTLREIEVVKLCIDKKSNREIAATLGVKPSTVKAHKLHIYQKCGGSTLIDILRYGMSRGIISAEDLGAGNGGATC